MSSIYKCDICGVEGKYSYEAKEILVDDVCQITTNVDNKYDICDKCLVELSDAGDKIQKAVDARWKTVIEEEIKKVAIDDKFGELARKSGPYGDTNTFQSCRNAKFRLESQGEDK